MRYIDIAWKNLWRRKAKTLFLLMGIILGVITIVTLLIISQAMNEEINNKFDQIGSNMVVMPKNDGFTLSYGGVSVNTGTIETKELSQDVVEKIKSIENADNISVIAPKLLGTLKTDQGRILAVGVDFKKEFRIKQWWHLEGSKPLNKNDVILGYTLAKQLNKKVGSNILVDKKKLVITGILQEIGSEEDTALYLDLALLQNLLNKENKLSFIELSALCYSCPIEDIVAQIKEKLPDARVTAVLEAVEARKDIVDKFSILANAVSVIVLIIGFFIVGISLVAVINQRRKEIGIFKAIGFSRKHIMLIFLLEIIVISIMAGALGYLAGVLLAKWLAPLVAQMEVPVTYQWSWAVITLIITVFTGIMGSLVPIIRAAGQNPADALKSL